jgi:hypothetical protein
MPRNISTLHFEQVGRSSMLGLIDITAWVDNTPAIFPRFVFRQMPLRVPSSVIFVQQNCHLDINAVPTEGGGQRYRAVVRGGYVDRGARHPDYRNPMRESQTVRTPLTLMSHILVGQLLGGYPRQHLTTVGSWGWFSTSVFAV